jgi:hypothetical protein
MSDLYDVRLAIPETYINDYVVERDSSVDNTDNSTTDRKKIKIIINENERTYFNELYSDYLREKNLKNPTR